MNNKKVFILIALCITFSLIANFASNASSNPALHYGLASLQLGLVCLAIIIFTIYALTALLNKVCIENILKMLLATALVVVIVPTYVRLTYQLAKAVLQEIKSNTTIPTAQLKNVPPVTVTPTPTTNPQPLEKNLNETFGITDIEPGRETQDIFVPEATLTKEPTASNAKQPSADHVVTTVANIQELNTLLQANPVVVVKCFATWCPPCQAMKPIFEKVAQNTQNSVKFAELDIDKFLDSNQLNVQLLPTVIYYKNGKEISRTTGFKNEEELKPEIAKLLA